MDDIVALTHPADVHRVLNLCQRARDYIELETGAGPDAAYVHDVMTDAPPSVPPENTWCWGAQRDGRLSALATCLKGYYDADDWYMGLLLLDPAARGAGLGARMARHVIAQARRGGGICMRVAILDSNPRARVFWQRLGFEHEKSTAAGDGQMRHVHRLPLIGRAE